MLNNTQLGLGLMLFVIFLVIFVAMRSRKEGYGVFSHRGALHGIQAGTRNFYSLDELKYQNPIDYWNYKTACKGCKKRNVGAMSIYDRDIQSYHAKRFDPEMTM